MDCPTRCCNAPGGTLKVAPNMTNLAALQILHHTQGTILAMDQALNNLSLKDANTMLDPTVAKVIADIDADTTLVANRIQKFITDAQAAGSVSAAETVAALQPLADHLAALGTDPGAPVPPLVP